jgi:DNA-binding MarR family transcriptional regulator
VATLPKKSKAKHLFRYEMIESFLKKQPAYAPGFTSTPLVGDSAAPRALQSDGRRHTALIHAYAAALHPVFFAAAFFGAAAFLIAWLLPEHPLRTVTKAMDLEETYAMPMQRTSEAEIERALSVLSSRESLRRAYRHLADTANVDLTPGETWLLIRIGQLGPHTVAKLADALHAPLGELSAALATLCRGDFACSNGVVELTASGRDAYRRLVAAREETLERYLADWPPAQRAQMREIIVTLAQRVLHESFAEDLRAAVGTVSKNA